MPWSDWQPGFEFTEPTQFQDESGAGTNTPHLYHLFNDAGAGGYASFAAALADVGAQLDVAANPTGLIIQGSGTLGGSNTSTSGYQSWRQFFEVDEDLIAGRGIRVGVALFQWLATFIDPGYTATLPAPPAPPGASDYEFDGDASTKVGWDPWTLDFAHGYQTFGENVAIRQGTSPSTDYFDDWTPYASYRVVDPTSLSFALIYASEDGGHDSSGRYPAIMWPTPGIGVETDRADNPLSTSGSVHRVGPVSIDMGGAGIADTITLVIQPSTMIEGSPSLHAPVPDPGDVLRSAAIAEGWDISSLSDPAFVPTPPRVRYVTPRWRYFTQESIYTIGGHWADPNGVQVKRLKDDGVTWIPIVDGLAPPLRP